MKLSKAIREAIDNHLASSYEDTAGKAITLFGAFSYTMPQSTAFRLSRDREESSIGWKDAESFKTAQAIRSMYAEFLALEQEDIEEAANVIFDGINTKDDKFWEDK